MSQTKEQDKPGKVLTETQIRNLPDKEFKVKRLTELEKQNRQTQEGPQKGENIKRPIRPEE